MANIYPYNDYLIADLIRANFSDQDLFINYLTERLGILVDSYNIVNYDKIVFSYLIRDGLTDKNRLILHPEKYEVNDHNFNNLKLPLTINPLEYGSLLAQQTFSDKTRYIVKNDIRVYTIDVTEHTNSVRIEGAVDLTWVDTKISDDLFKR